MGFLNLMSIDEVKQKIKDEFYRENLESEKVQLSKCIGRVSSKKIYSFENTPLFDRSTVDGYAVLAGDTFGASETVPCFLNVIDEIFMGEGKEISIKSGECVKVPTGGIIPTNSDGIVMIEYVEQIDEKTIAVNKSIAPNSNIIREGDDCKINHLLLEKGKIINELDIGILSAAGIFELDLIKMPKCSILSTGDEIIDIDEKIAKGKIRDTNSYVISAALQKRGIEITSRRIIKDNFLDIKNAIEESLADNDFVIMSGGSSVGEKDYTYSAINAIENGEVLVHGISIKPGKPSIIGKVGEKPVFGLPGQTVSCLIIFKIIVEYYLDLIYGTRNPKPVLAQLTENVHSSPGKMTFQSVQLIYEKDKILAKPVYGKSGLISQIQKSDGIFSIPENIEGYMAGEKVFVDLF